MNFLFDFYTNVLIIRVLKFITIKKTLQKKNFLQLFQKKNLYLLSNL
jgi:hypothetical protein